MSLLAIAPIVGRSLTVAARIDALQLQSEPGPEGTPSGSAQPQSPFEPAIGNALLLQADTLAQTVVPEVVVELVFGGSQTREFGIERRAFPDPKRLMNEQRLAVHQKRLRVREQHTQPVQDVEAVGIDVAPIVQRATVQ